MNSTTKKQRCTNNGVQKSAEVADGMRRLGNYNGMTELYSRGCFRHLEDVAYARIMLERDHQTVDEIATYLDASYDGLKARDHHCDRIYPPS